MPIIDMPLDQLRAYRPAATREPDFDAFWAETLQSASRIPLEPQLQLEADLPLPGVRAYRATYRSWDDALISGRYLAPEGKGPFPAIVIYHGYSGGVHRMSNEIFLWPLMGYATLAIDVRGQGGLSTDGSVYPEGHITGWMTQGISDPKRHYYRGVFVDCVRALDFVCQQPGVDARRIGVTGVSQGGGLTLAAAGLDPRPAAAFSEVPFLCHYRRAVDVSNARPYTEIGDYIRYQPGTDDLVFRTLSYFDAMNLAGRIQCPTYVTVGLQDLICPPSTVFAAYNALQVTKEIMVSTFGVHERFPGVVEKQIRWMHTYLKG
ncbi:MAG: acetylxylan esterase [Chloroflexi bacterium]|nr:acetylxylan esterase [Chloroflexota bacterium]